MGRTGVRRVSEITKGAGGGGGGGGNWRTRKEGGTMTTEAQQSTTWVTYFHLQSQTRGRRCGSGA